MGLVSWLENCDTLMVLIREYRDIRKIPVNQEQRLMLQMNPDYANLPIMGKIEIFKFALDSTDGTDFKNIIWRQSRTAEVWLERRTHFTRSVAVMSMVGYILGLGDRHCSNVSINRNSGKIVHTNFGDCFEVAQLRDRFAETVPFRLTRMLTTAMGVSGSEGLFRSICEKVMTALRDNKESLIAIFESFVYEPFITASWDDRQGTSKTPSSLNEKGNQIINRISSKLCGKDFSKDEPGQALDVREQVDKLIKEATDIENLSQMYLSWGPFW